MNMEQKLQHTLFIQTFRVIPEVVCAVYRQWREKWQMPSTSSDVPLCSELLLKCPLYVSMFAYCSCTIAASVWELDQNTLLPVSAEWAVALSCRMMAFSATYGHLSLIAHCRWYFAFDLSYCSFTVRSFGSDDTQVHLGCHRPKWSSALWVMDFVRPCVLMVNEDDTILRMVIRVLIHRPLPFFTSCS
jgi:hypothetical protein